ncbi:hypothetical protein [Acaryochloris marina]|uniref:hypothetical protein n=1 Tax=Acaryochloris marina TaxID=155978 RepID=UPI0021C495A3|nr:hypothetical protein [Acaryochloris marina]BDM82873.1 hypothetical protein AM10699_57340 [Acaryochloris marina MBIC10699]
MSARFTSQCTHRPGLFSGFASQTTRGLTGNAEDYPMICMVYDYTASSVFIILLVAGAIGVAVWCWERTLLKKHQKKTKDPKNNNPQTSPPLSDKRS